MSRQRQKHAGFTLFELMVVIAIVGIIAGIAWPLYQSQSAKNRRLEAVSDLGQLQVLLNRCYNDNGGYDCCQPIIDAYLLGTPPPVGNARNYTMTFIPTNVNGAVFACKQAQGYTLTAAATPGMSQDNDNFCVSFTVDHLGSRTALDSTATLRPACWAD